MSALVVEGLPVGDPVLIFALAMLVFLVAPLLFQRYRLPGIVGVILVALIVWAFMGGKTDSTADEAPDEPFDAFAGGYPVPPLPHQVQAPLAGAATATTVARRDHDENGGL